MIYDKVNWEIVFFEALSTAAETDIFWRPNLETEDIWISEKLWLKQSLMARCVLWIRPV